MQAKHSRQDIIDVAVRALKADERVRALWQGGSAANYRADEYSDVDFVAIADGDSTVPVFANLEAALDGSFGIDLLWKVPEPTWHGHSQRFYRLKDTDPCHLIDFVVQRRNASNRFLDSSRHGTPLVYFDYDGLVKPEPVPMNWDQKIADRKAELAVMFPMFQAFIGKELRRNRPVDAFSFYTSMTIRPLVELLRIAYCPERFDFGLRYLTHDLPKEIAAEVSSLVYVASPSELLAKQAAAEALFDRTMTKLNG